MTVKKSSRPATEHYDKLIKILGKKYIGSRMENSFEFISIASKGVNSQVIINFRNHFNIPKRFTAQLLNVSESTINRWIRSNKILDRNHSVQLLELTDLFLYGTEVFDNRDHFFKWLDLPNTALGGLKPKELLEIPGGISKVKDLLGQIEYGVYS